MPDLYGFERIREQEVVEVNSVARLYRHRATGAQLLSLENDDEHKAFGITFRTPPTDSTGVAHILEHSVLCGSRKYPLKEPFVELIKGSLKTYLNALTYPDKTCYPVASQNTQDFYNLMDVYLDAVFSPRLSEATFLQEGWHYELEDASHPLIFKGVVFNEMKGAYASPVRLLGEYARQSLFPDTTYGLSSGGEPRYIPDLSYEQFKAFHQTYYHPSNAYFFFYGNDDPEERLRRVADYLKHFTYLDIDASVPLQALFDQPRYITLPYAVNPQSPDGEKAMITVNWLLDETGDADLMLSFHILGYILVGMLASPLRRALTESGLGEDMAGSGMASGLRQAYLSTGLKGIAPDDAGAIETLILQTLESLVRDGLDPETVEAAINTIEFHLRENNTGSLPRGLALMFRALIPWIHGGDPLAPLMFEAPLAALKARLARGERYFESLIERYLVANAHRTTLLLVPDPQQGQRETEAERTRLEQARAAMSEADVQSIIETTRQLKQLQETPDPPEALTVIPWLKLDDLDRQNKVFPQEMFDDDGTEEPSAVQHPTFSHTGMVYHPLDTGGIVYMDIGFNLRVLPPELLPYVALFGRALREMGTEAEDYTRLAQRIGRKTGGIRAQPVCMATHEGNTMAWMFLRTKATHSQTHELLAILRDILLTPRLDDYDRFHQIVLEAKAREEMAIVPGGNGYVNLRMRALYNEADWANEHIGGISHLFFLRNLVREMETDWPAVRAKLEHVRELLINRRAMLFNITIDRKYWHACIPQIRQFLSLLPSSLPVTLSWSPTYSSGFEGLTAPTRVNYVGKSVNLFDLGYHLHGSVGVITNYLRTTWLWDQVRVKGGAYGCFCRFGRHTGILCLVSYRDPNLLATLDVFDQAGHFLRTTPLDKEEVTRSIIGRIGELDSYQYPDARGFASLLRTLSGHTEEIRQRKREEILETTTAHFRQFADMLDHVRERGNVVVLGSQQAIERANAERNDLLVPVKVL